MASNFSIMFIHTRLSLTCMFIGQKLDLKTQSKNLEHGEVKGE